MKIVTIILLITVTVTTGCRVHQDWWQSAAIYQIFPATFRDSDGDGFGDLNGITEKLDYIASLGVQAIWLSPIFGSTWTSSGYDVTDYYDINSKMGTIADFSKLMVKAKSNGLKVILDMIPNHSSKYHEWFERSIERDPLYSDYYIWRPKRTGDSGEPLPPSNWISVIGGSMWNYNERRGEYYLSQFHANLPDFNLHNPAVKEEFNKIYKFWMDFGVDGFRIDAITHLFEEIPTDVNTPPDDEPLAWDPAVTDPNDYGFYNHLLTRDLDETYDLVYDWRELLDTYKKEHPGSTTRIMFTETYSEVRYLVRYYGSGTRDGSHFPLNFEFINHLTDTSNATDVQLVIDRFLSMIPDGKYIPNWVIGNHDKSRVATRMGSERVNIMNMMQMTLPGIVVVYNGDEIGMEDVCLNYNAAENRHTACAEGEFANPDYFDDATVRTPMQWDDSLNAGFSSNPNPYLPVGHNYQILNIAKQESVLRSHLNIYRSLMKIRQRYEAMRTGKIETKILSEYVFSYIRYLPGVNTFVVLLNFGSTAQQVKIADSFSSLRSNLVVHLGSDNSIYETGRVLRLSETINLAPYDGLVLEENERALPIMYRINKKR